MVSANGGGRVRKILSNMAMLSGGSAHLQQEETLLPMLRRMGLEPGATGSAMLAGTRARRYPISYGGRTLELLQLDCDSVFAAQLGGRHPGVIEKHFVPRPGGMVALRWSGRDSQPRRLVDDILATIGILGAFLYPAYVLWSPAAIWSHGPALSKSIGKYFAGDLLPIMRLVSFVPDKRVNDNIVRTEGLAPFVGQEIEAGSNDREITETVRHLARIALDMFEYGAIDREVSIDGLRPGERIMLKPRPNGKIVDVDIRHR